MPQNLADNFIYCSIKCALVALKKNHTGFCYYFIVPQGTPGETFHCREIQWKFSQITGYDEFILLFEIQLCFN